MLQTLDLRSLLLMKRRRGMTAHRTAAQRHVLSVPQVRQSVQRLTFPVTGGNATCALRDAIESELFLTRLSHPRVKLASVQFEL